MKKLSTEEEPEDILYQQNISTNQFLLITLTSSSYSICSNEIVAEINFALTIISDL